MIIVYFKSWMESEKESSQFDDIPIPTASNKNNKAEFFFLSSFNSIKILPLRTIAWSITDSKKEMSNFAILHFLYRLMAS